MSQRLRRRSWWFPAVAVALTLLAHQHVPTLDRGVLADGHWGLVALAMFAAQILPVHVTTNRGRHTVTVTEAVVAAGLLTVSPGNLIVGAALGAAPALLRTRPTRLKYAVNLAQTWLWIVLTTLAFHTMVDALTVSTPRAVATAFLTGVIAFLGAALTIRIPIGLATGAWSMAEGEIAGVATAFAIAVSALSIALLGVVLSTVSPPYLVLLGLPLAQVGLAMRQHARVEESRRILDVVITTADRLRTVEDAVGTLEETLLNVQEAYGANEALLLVTDGTGHPARRRAHGGDVEVIEALPDGMEEGLRAWLDDHSLDGPTTARSPHADGLRNLLPEREFLVLPLPTSREPGIVVLLGRPLGPYGPDHVELARTLGAAASAALDRAALSTELDEAGRREAELERRASHDALTGLPNRALLHRELDAALDRRSTTAVLFVDLSGFKEVNDTLGHQTGDALLVETGARIAASVRPGDVVARMGGDEFAVLLRDGDLEIARTIGRRVLNALGRPVPSAGLAAIRAAVGAAASTGDESAAELLHRADEAMYGAKRGGSVTVHVSEAAA